MPFQKHLECPRPDSTANLIMSLPTHSLHIPLCLDPSQSPHLLDTSLLPPGYPSPPGYLTTWKTLLTTWIAPSSSAQEPHPQGPSPTFCSPHAMCRSSHHRWWWFNLCLCPPATPEEGLRGQGHSCPQAPRSHFWISVFCPSGFRSLGHLRGGSSSSYYCCLLKLI